LTPQKLHNRSEDPALEARLSDLMDQMYTFYAQEIDMDLGRVERFLKQLGNPHLDLPPVIHVAGTNGKGSTIAALRRLFEASGKKVHVYTSPHLIHPTERIRLNGEPITTKALIDLLEECLAVNRSEPITFFEIFTAAFFLAAKRTPADIILLETGMGGRLDATNVIPDPACTIITTISKDHEKFLGDTLPAIATEKAGILKAGVPCIIAPQPTTPSREDVLKVIQEKVTDLSPVAPVYQYGSQWSIDPVHNQLHFRWKDEIYLVRQPNLIGSHQYGNIGSALAAYRVVMGQDFDPKVLSPAYPENPLGTIFWPGRLQRMTEGALFDAIKPGQELWLDGGHNDSAGQILSVQAQRWKEEDARPLCLIVAMVDRKDPIAFLSPLVPYVHEIIFSSVPDETNSYEASELHNLCGKLEFRKTYVNNDIFQALKSFKAQNARILITGSLYLIGNIQNQMPQVIHK
jgi:dihydrofolate synthase/folylpolyglutamate synthase